MYANQLLYLNYVNEAHLLSDSLTVIARFIRLALTLSSSERLSNARRRTSSVEVARSSLFACSRSSSLDSSRRISRRSTIATSAWRSRRRRRRRLRLCLRLRQHHATVFCLSSSRCNATTTNATSGTRAKSTSVFWNRPTQGNTCSDNGFVFCVCVNILKLYSSDLDIIAANHGLHRTLLVFNAKLRPKTDIILSEFSVAACKHHILHVVLTYQRPIGCLITVTAFLPEIWASKCFRHCCYAAGCHRPSPPTRLDRFQRRSRMCLWNGTSGRTCRLYLVAKLRVASHRLLDDIPDVASRRAESRGWNTYSAAV